MSNVSTIKNSADEDILVYSKPTRHHDAKEEGCLMWLEFYDSGEPYIYIRAKSYDLMLTMNDNVIKLGLLKVNVLTDYQGAAAVSRGEEVSATGPLRPIFATAVKMLSDHYIDKYVLSDLK